MSPRKLSRKGKLDQDLPFREPKTFAIFPKCFDEWEFYDLENDPGEIRNLYSDLEYIETIENTKNLLFELQREVEDPIMNKVEGIE